MRLIRQIISIYDYDYEQFQTFCNDEGLSKSEITRGLIRKYCDTCEDAQHTAQEVKNPPVVFVVD